jgi:hypothetical protein
MKTTTNKSAAKKVAAKKTAAKKIAAPSKSHSISCDDATWGKIQAAAKKAGMNVSKYIISKLVK